MMKQKSILVILALLLLPAMRLAAREPSGGFVIQNADDSVMLSLTASGELNNLVNGIAPRMIVEYANSLRYHELVPIPSALQTLLEQVEARFVIEYANANRFLALSYPEALVGDTVPPQATEIDTDPAGGGTVAISWTTSEYTSSVIEYGTQSGNYTQSVSDDWYRKQHQITLTGLTAGQTYYFHILSADRSGNISQSGEYSFVGVISVYLPVVTRK